MTNLLEIKGVVCRPCGAVYAQPSETEGLCLSCSSRYRLWIRKEKPTELNKNKWLASVLTNNLNRQKKFGVCGRCEAVTQQSTITNNAYYQCAAYATILSNGRRLCNSHAVKANHAVFTDNVINPYTHVENIINDLVKIDQELKMAIIRGLND